MVGAGSRKSSTVKSLWGLGNAGQERRETGGGLVSGWRSGSGRMPPESLDGPEEKPVEARATVSATETLLILVIL